MKIIYIFVFIFISCALSAQIVITSSSFPKLGDTLRTAIDNLPSGIDVGTPGASKVWDFRKLQAPFNIEQILKNPTQSENGNVFPGANWFYTGQGDAEFFYRKTNSTVLQMGFSGNNVLSGFDLSIIAKNEPNLVEKTAPMRYEDSFNSSSVQTIPFSAAIIPDTFFAGLPVRPDSIRLNTRITQNSTIDAWGTMMIPMGTFDVLRENRMIINDRKVEAKSNALPFWIDISSFFQIPGLTGKDTTYTYYFWSDKSIEPVALVQTNGMEQQITSIQFKSDPQVTSYSNPVNRVYDVVAYPNPAIGSVRFDINGLQDGNYRLRIYNLLGQEVWSKRYLISGGKRTIKLELGTFEKGTYLYSLSDEKGKTLITKRLVVLMP
jgi:hypothetical protein